MLPDSKHFSILFHPFRYRYIIFFSWVECYTGKVKLSCASCRYKIAINAFDYYSQSCPFSIVNFPIAIGMEKVVILAKALKCPNNIASLPLRSTLRNTLIQNSDGSTHFGYAT